MKKVLILFFIALLAPLCFALDSSLTYMNGLGYGNTILRGSAAWDHLDRINMQTGLVIVRPLEENPRFASRIRIAFDQPLWANIRQLDGGQNTIQAPGSLGYGAQFFAGLEIPLETRKSLFSSLSAQAGPVLGFQAMSDSLLVTLGFEGGVEGGIALGGKWSFMTGLSLHYDFWGIHSAGDSSRYDLYIERGWGVCLSPGIRYTY